MKRFVKSILCLVIALATVAACSLAGCITASAVSYEGDGTAASPYLVKTAQQLDGMRNNLTAHYKLAADIDLSGYAAADPTPKKNYDGKWVPIGVYGEDKSFRGSFTCDTDANGEPLYTIRNLTVVNKAGTIYGHTVNRYQSYTDAKDGECYWEAGLFGTVRGATISNIKIVNANITNTVLGQNQMTDEGTTAIVPCNNQMGAAILAAKAYDSRIEGCSVEGTVTSATNGVGGLIGTASKTTVEDSQAKVTVKGTGMWCCAGFIGIAEDKCKINNCYVYANVDTVASGPAIFATGSTSTYRNCYADGTINNGDTLIQTAAVNRYVFNCFSLGKRTDGKTGGAAEAVNNCYVVGGYSSLYASATLEELKNAYAGISGWDCSGEYPVLAKAGSNSGSTGADGDNGSANGGTAVIPVAPAENVVYVNGIDIMGALEELPDAYDIELADAEKYLEIYWAYTALPENLKAELTEAQHTSVAEIGKVLSKSVLKDIESRVAALPEGEQLSSDNANELNDIAQMYQLMTPEYRSKMDRTLFKKLCDSLEKLGLSGVVITPESPDNSFVTWILVFCAVLNGMILVATVVVITYVVVKMKKVERSR